MADEKITAQIGCPKCGTVLFDLVAVPTGSRGVFQNEMRARDGAPEGASTKVCGVDDCGATLERVPAP